MTDATLTAAPLSASRGRPRDPSRDVAIVAAARSVVATNGFTGASMEEIARQAGVGKDTLYRRWSSKEQLVRHMLDTIADEGVRARAVDDDPRLSLFVFLQDVVRLNARSDFGAIVAGVVGASARNPELAATFHAFWESRRAIAGGLVREIVGAAPPERDIDRILDHLLGPIYYRLLLTGAPLTDIYLWELVVGVPWPDAESPSPSLNWQALLEKEPPMYQHILTIVEPTSAGESPLSIAADAVAAGGRATVVVHVNAQTRRDISEFAHAEDLSIGEAEQIAVDRFVAEYTALLGPNADIRVVYASPATDAIIRLARELDASMIAVAADFTTNHSLQKLTDASHLPVVIAPARARVAA